MARKSGSRRQRKPVPHRSWEALAPPKPAPSTQPPTHPPAPVGNDELGRFPVAAPGDQLESVYDVEVTYVEPDPTDLDDAPTWAAEGGIRGSSHGVDFEPVTSLAALQRDVEDEAAQHRHRFPDLQISYTFDDRHTAQVAAAREGLELPSAISWTDE